MAVYYYVGLSASSTTDTIDTLTQFCVRCPIPGKNIMLERVTYMVRVRENVVAADVENDEIFSLVRLPSPLPICCAG